MLGKQYTLHTGAKTQILSKKVWIISNYKQEYKDVEVRVQAWDRALKKCPWGKLGNCFVKYEKLMFFKGKGLKYWGRS